MTLQKTLGFHASGRAGSNGRVWSISRDGQLQACERKYYFQYLAGGRVNSPDPRLRRIGLLKKLQSVSMWKGDCLHWAIARYLSDIRDGARSFVEGLREDLRVKLRREWEFSEQRRFRQQPMSIDRGGLALLEHEYDQMPATITPESVFGEVNAMVGRFLDWAAGPSGLEAKVADADNTWIEPPGFGPDAPGIFLDGVQVLTKVDLAIEKSGSYFEIYDWKSQEAERGPSPHMGQNELQVRVYQLWPHMTMDLPLQQIFAHLIYLGGAAAEVRSHRLDERAVPLTVSMVRDSIAMAQMFDQNIADGLMNLDDLDYASSPGFCRLCPFKGLCREDLTHETAH
jgi:hypothetical protein